MNWYVGTTKGQQELFAAGQLIERKFIVRVPMRYTRIESGRKSFARADIRFKRYIFIRCEPHEVGQISVTPGMDAPRGYSALVGANSAEGFVPYQLQPKYLIALDRIMFRELEEAAASKPEPRTDLTPGDEVEIDKPGDAFHGKSGIYFESANGVATVFLGAFPKKISEIFLKRVEAERKAA